MAWTPDLEQELTEEEIKEIKKEEAKKKASSTRKKTQEIKSKALEQAKEDLKKEQKFLQLQAENNPIVNEEKKEKNRDLMQHLQWSLLMPKIDLDDANQVSTRINEYINHCIVDGYRPTVSGLANALGTTRDVLQEYRYGTKIKSEVSELITRAYVLLEELWELALNNGDINPIAGMFFGKNNYQYSDKTEVQITAIQGKEKSDEDLIKEYEEREDLLS